MNLPNTSLIILYRILAIVRTSANLKNYTKYSMNVTFSLQKSISMWYNYKSYSMQVVKSSINYGMYGFWYISYDRIKTKKEKEAYK